MTNTAKIAFEALKVAVTETPCLVLPSWDEPFEVWTPVLQQNIHLVAFLFRKLNSVESPRAFKYEPWVYLWHTLVRRCKEWSMGWNSATPCLVCLADLNCLSMGLILVSMVGDLLPGGIVRNDV
ncbi:hypothetical protein GOP47_0013111 [Adiantum capillus-veneris]|uniref:Uncharacterized protein n=1 Tax=Adiantum capillus-veneris TaxID=13818 RepID=A0A9D4URZ8_ADICA|nr:hypothetical protein GOP47_0013111 [Adiantum capillus-veneris]